MQSWLGGAVCVCAIAGANSAAYAGHYVYTTLDVPGGTATDAQTIDRQGNVGGVYVGADGLQHGFTLSNGVYTTFAAKEGNRQVDEVWPAGHGRAVLQNGRDRGSHAGVFLGGRDGKIRRLTIPGAVKSVATAANDAGDVAGVYYAGSAETTGYGFVASHGAVQTLAYPGATLTVPAAIGRDGRIIGDLLPSSSGGFHGFVEKNGHFSLFDPPRSSSTFVESVSDSGVVSGLFYSPHGSTNTQGFTLDHGRYTVFRYPAADPNVTEARYAVSDRQVAGDWYNVVVERSINIVDGVYYIAEPAGAAWSYLEAANAAGTLVGEYADEAGVLHGFMATCPAGQAPCTD